MKTFISLVAFFILLSANAKQIIRCEDGNLYFSFNEDSMRELQYTYVKDENISLKGRLTHVGFGEDEVELRKYGEFGIASSLRIPKKVLGINKEEFVAKYGFRSSEGYGYYEVRCESIIK